jgi:hypothetical protein
MVDPRKERAQDIYLQAIELDGAERDAFVRDACQGDEELLVEVRRLLDAEDDVESKFLEPPSIPESTEPKPPPRLGEFVLIAEIGRGGMGVVYEARQVGLDRRVAVKLISRSLTTSKHDVLRFHREARNMAKLQHPGIVQVYTDGEAEQFHYFAMELVDGHDLAYELRLQRSSRADDGDLLLPPRADATFVPAAARLVRDAALALQFAHQNGIVHRDIKPHNMLIGRDGRTRVADFGLARNENLGSVSVTGAGAGTPHYMSPEQTRAATRVDFRTDVYSLGVVLYELLTFKRPFDGTTSADVQRAIRVEDPVPVRRRSQSVPLDLETICHQAMAREAGDRYQTAQQLADDLDRFLAHEAIVARPPGLAARARKALRRHRVAVMLVAAMLATTIVVWTAFAANQRTQWLREQRAPIEALLEAPPWTPDRIEELIVARRHAAALRDDGDRTSLALLRQFDPRLAAAHEAWQQDGNRMLVEAMVGNPGANAIAIDDAKAIQAILLLIDLGRLFPEDQSLQDRDLTLAF